MTDCTRESSFSGGQLPLTPLQATTPSQMLPVRGPVLSSQEPWSQGHPCPMPSPRASKDIHTQPFRDCGPSLVSCMELPGQALILPLTAAQEGAYHPLHGLPGAPDHCQLQGRFWRRWQSFRTSSCFVGEYFNWLKLNRVHPGKGGGVYCTQTSWF